MMDDPRNEVRLAAWRAFFENGRIDHEWVRPEVAASWKKCAELGLDPRAPKVSVKLSATELAAVRAKNKEFIGTALPFMRFLETAVSGSGFILVVTDDDGIVLEAFGDRDIKRMAEENNYVPGCCRMEMDVGTNAIGLSMEMRKPVQITCPEHFNVRHHSWTCASAPVFSPDKRLLGSVTLSGKSTDAHRHTLGMVISAAGAIEDRLRQREAAREKSRMGVLVDSILSSISEAIITVSGDGTIMRVNDRASRLIGAKPADCEGKPIVELFPANPEILEIVLEGKVSPPVEVAIDAGKRRSYVMLKPFLVHGEQNVEGAILVLSERKELFNKVREVSGFHAKFDFPDIIGRAPVFERQIELAKIAAKQDSRILVSGETGTGKELFAQAIHNNSARRNGPFVAINCAAIPRDLIESEIMGYTGGAFTGARKGGQVGKLELADGGTVFLDEISQMPLDMQAKFLRVLQDGIITRLGDTKPLHVDVRIMAATNEDLFEKSMNGGFRQDLYFRLSVVEIALPALRERLDDLPELAAHIMARISRKFDNKDKRVSGKALKCLAAYDWPGNIRELENVLEMAAIICEGGVIQEKNLSPRIRERDFRGAGGATFKSIRDIESDVLRTAMKELGGNIALVSRQLGMSRSTIYRRMKEYGISRSVQVE